ncbi:ArsC/Spx/MgsR family protein [Gemmobacter denitrificans]|uniref:ArsC/Spx/MgsR family protein n=1 Tax=Gemmobacter denitrificans TaxID=3123040 RepID=A0ABU8BPL5_9RHOB
MTKSNPAATIWHNPACSSSRKALAALEDAGLTPRVIRYLDTGWTEESLQDLLAAAGLRPSDALRHKAPGAAALRGAAEATILAAMLADPVLVERPFVQTDRGTALCRPLARLEDLLPLGADPAKG